jgi:transcriptional regulator with XRE-family HTH domain
MKRSFGEIIKDKRLTLGMTQQEVAERIGATAASIGNWERDRFIPNILLACDLADVFGCSLDELCGRNIGEKYG